MKKVFLMVVFLLLITACTKDYLHECNKQKEQSTIDNCFFETAIRGANLTLCSHIQMEPLREACISEIGVALNDINMCANLDEVTKGNCYAQLAINNENVSICEFIESDYWWDICYFELGILKNEPEFCSEMSVTNERRDECFITVASVSQNEEICGWVASADQKNYCIRKIALIKGDVEICYGIENELWREGNCIMKLAINTTDSFLCELIKKEDIKEKCLELS